LTLFNPLSSQFVNYHCCSFFDHWNARDYLPVDEIKNWANYFSDIIRSETVSQIPEPKGKLPGIGHTPLIDAAEPVQSLLAL